MAPNTYKVTLTCTRRCKAIVEVTAYSIAQARDLAIAESWDANWEDDDTVYRGPDLRTTSVIDMGPAKLIRITPEKAR